VVARVTYDAGDNCFYAELLDQCQPEASLSELIASYGPAWQLHEPGSSVLSDEP
jgi:hypothetical protein